MTIISFLFGVAMLLLILWLALQAGLLDKSHHEEQNQKEQESEAMGVVDSMKGELDHLRKDGLL